MTKTLSILTVDDKNSEILQKSCKRIKNPFETDIIFLMQKMKEILKDKRTAGVAAPQLGMSVQLFAMQLDKSKPPQFFFNPKIETFSPTIKTEQEGCLSVPDKYGMVERSETIVAKWYNQNNAVKRQMFSGFEARAFQHEMDHINGTIYTAITDQVFDVQQSEEAFIEAKNREEFNPVEGYLDYVVDKSHQEILLEKQLEVMKKGLKANGVG